MSVHVSVCACVLPCAICLTLKAVAAVIAMLVPFFNDVVGLLGALGFWPLTVFLPIQMHIKQAGLSSMLTCLWQSLHADTACVPQSRKVGMHKHA